MTKQTAARAIENAKAHAPKASMHSNGDRGVFSAFFCIKDAEACLADGQFQHAFDWAVRSLGYSVGVFKAKEVAMFGEQKRL